MANALSQEDKEALEKVIKSFGAAMKESSEAIVCGFRSMADSLKPFHEWAKNNIDELERLKPFIEGTKDDSTED